MRFFHHFALEVDEESIADELERGKVYPIKKIYFSYFSHYNVEGAAWCFFYFSVTLITEKKGDSSIV